MAKTEKSTTPNMDAAIEKMQPKVIPGPRLAEVANNDPIHVRMARIAAKAKYLQKSSRNEAQSYNFASEADYLELAKPLLAEEGVWLAIDVESVEFRKMPPTKSGQERELCVVRITGLLCCESGEFTVHSVGTGVDTGDKAVYKAVTGAVKYLIAKNLQIPTGDDPEVSNPAADERPVERTEPKAPREAVKALSEPAEPKADQSAEIDLDGFREALGKEKERLGDDVFKRAMRGFGYGKTVDIPQKRYKEILKALFVLTPGGDDE